MSGYDASLQLTSNPAGAPGLAPRVGVVILGAGLLTLLIASIGIGTGQPVAMLFAGLGLTVTGALVYVADKYNRTPPAAQNNGIMFSATTTRSAFSWGLAGAITAFYILLYWFPATLDGLKRITDPLAVILTGKTPDNAWFMYGLFYTVAVMVMGIRALLKYRHNRYQVARTLSVIFFQLVLAFLIPNILVLFQ